MLHRKSFELVPPLLLSAFRISQQQNIRNCPSTTSQNRNRAQPRSAFHIYVLDARDKIRMTGDSNEPNDLSYSQLMPLIAKSWKHLDQAGRSIYETAAEFDVQRFATEQQQILATNNRSSNNKRTRPLSGLHAFIKQELRLFNRREGNGNNKSNTNLTTEQKSAVMKEIHGKWRQLSKKQRSQYNSVADSINSNSIFDNGGNGAGEKKSKAVSKRGKRQLRRLKSDYEMPKEPLKPFNVFQSRQKQQLTESIPQYSKRIARLWNSLPDGAKYPYQMDYAAQKSAYNRKLQTWISVMISDGKEDIVQSLLPKTLWRASSALKLKSPPSA